MLRLVVSTPGQDAQAIYAKPTVTRFGGFRELTKYVNGAESVSVFSERRRSVAFLGLLSPNTPKPDQQTKV